MYKAIWKLLIVSVMIMLYGGVGFAPAALAASAVPSVGAQAAALIDVTSGRFLYSKRGDQELPIASLTKIMTAIVAIEHGKLSDPVTVSKNAFGKEGSSIYLKLGQQMSLNDMLYGLMLRSGNDAATAIAEHVGGSLDGFVFLMNQTARDLGLSHTQFVNPHGLDAPGHFSSANDFAKLTAYALRNPVFREIVKTPVKKVANPDESWDTVWANKNKMLALYPGADGVKTGYTKVAKRCLVSSATRGGQQLAVVTLNDPDDWADHARLLDYGFRQYPLQTVVKQGEKLNGGYMVAQTLRYALSESESGAITRQVEMEPSNSVNRRLGQAGTLKFLLDGHAIGTVPIVAADSPQLRQTEYSVFQYGTRFLNTFEGVLRALFTRAA